MRSKITAALKEAAILNAELCIKKTSACLKKIYLNNADVYVPVKFYEKYLFPSYENIYGKNISTVSFFRGPLVKCKLLSRCCRIIF